MVKEKYELVNLDEDFEQYLLQSKIVFWNKFFKTNGIKNLWFDTFNSHKLIYWSKEYDCHTEVVENLFKAYFEKSKDISNIDILLEIAEDSGLNKEEIRKKFSEDVDNETIIEEEKKNRENGVMGVPTYVINDGITLTGSQSVDSLVKLLKHMSSN